MNGRLYLRFFVAFFALWLSVLSFSTAVAAVVYNPASLNPYSQSSTQKIAKPDWVLDFENEIDSADTLTLSYSKDGYAQDIRRKKPIKNTAATSEAGTISNLSAKSEKESTKAVLPTRIVIDSLSKDLKVDNPQSTKISDLNKGLKKAVLRYPGTGRLDENSRNMIIFGHSSHLPTDRVFNKMYRAFNGIEKLQKGVKIKIYGDDGKLYVYKVKNVKRMRAGEDELLVANKNKGLMLVTCDNFGAKEDRWVVEAEFDYSI